MSVLNAKHFHDEEAAFAKLESVLWPGYESGGKAPSNKKAK